MSALRTAAPVQLSAGEPASWRSFGWSACHALGSLTLNTPCPYLRHPQADVHAIRIDCLLDEEDFVRAHEKRRALAELLQSWQEAWRPADVSACNL